MDDAALIEKAQAAAHHSLLHISTRPGGAALISLSGRVFVGATIEVSNLGSSICAPRVAVFAALSDGVRQFDRIAVVGPEQNGRLCGECRQLLRDFASTTVVLGSTGAVIPPEYGLPRFRQGAANV
jgi:cytidine deaminase